MTVRALRADAPPTRPVLRYHGGKWKLAPWVIEHFPPHRIYMRVWRKQRTLELHELRKMVRSAA